MTFIFLSNLLHSWQFIRYNDQIICVIKIKVNLKNKQLLQTQTYPQNITIKKEKRKDWLGLEKIRSRV